MRSADPYSIPMVFLWVNSDNLMASPGFRGFYSCFHRSFSPAGTGPVMLDSESPKIMGWRVDCALPNLSNGPTEMTFGSYLSGFFSVQCPIPSLDWYQIFSNTVSPDFFLYSFPSRPLSLASYSAEERTPQSALIERTWWTMKVAPCVHVSGHIFSRFFPISTGRRKIPTPPYRLFVFFQNA